MTVTFYCIVLLHGVNETGSNCFKFSIVFNIIYRELEKTT